MATEETRALLAEARKAERAVYLATEKAVADDISRIIRGLASALEARQVDEAKFTEDQLLAGASAMADLDSDCVEPSWDDLLRTALGAMSVEFLGERHEEWCHKGECSEPAHCTCGVGERHEPEPTDDDLALDEFELNEPELVKCDYCGDELPSVKHRSHIPTTPDLQRRGFAADKIVCGECTKNPVAPQPSESDALIEEAAATIAVPDLLHSRITWGDMMEFNKDRYRSTAREVLALLSRAAAPAETEWEYGMQDDYGLDYAKDLAHAKDKESRQNPELNPRAVRRRKASEWLPVPGGEGEGS